MRFGNATLQEEGADLVDDASALTDQPLTHTMQRLQIELIGGLRRHELHRWPLHRLGDRLRVPRKSFFCPLESSC
jgi:hypothetical protein